MVRVGQKWFINWDDGMYHEQTKTFAECRNSNLNEELGQIHYLLSDKTGTLTQNQMNLRMCYVDGVSYGNYMDLLEQMKNNPAHKFVKVFTNKLLFLKILISIADRCR